MAEVLALQIDLWAATMFCKTFGIKERSRSSHEILQIVVHLILKR
jgi:hypothetical protein